MNRYRKRKTDSIIYPISLVILLSVCAGTPVAETTPILSPADTATPTATHPPLPTASPTRTATLTVTPAPAITPTPDPYAGLIIADLRARDYGGGELQMESTLEVTNAFTRTLIYYLSDGLTIYSFMNVPQGQGPFPVALVLHGYIPPERYYTVAYTARYADALARAGYLVIHPNLRNYPPSDEGPDQFRVGSAMDVLNLIAIVREQSGQPGPFVVKYQYNRKHRPGTARLVREMYECPSLGPRGLSLTKSRPDHRAVLLLAYWLSSFACYGVTVVNGLVIMLPTCMIAHFQVQYVL